MMMKIVLVAMGLMLLSAAPADDKMTTIPGYPADYNTSIYTGYLDIKNANRSLHYVFVESAQGKDNRDPVTLWLNGGPGCSSLLGFIQEIGPYYLEDGIDYRLGDNLTKNKYSWHNISNLLFLESPAGVGYSYNLDKSYEYNDYNTADDNLKAVVSFFEKFPEYKGRKLFIAGESYAGKYIPDLAALIDQWNQRGEGTAINLVSIIVGNGVMAFDTLQRSTYEFMIDRKFVDPEIVPIYQSSCQSDPDSAGCRFFEIEYDKGTEQLNPYNVYGYCYYNDSFDLNGQRQERKEFVSQESILNKLKKQFSPGPTPPMGKFNGAPCAFFDGIHDYFNLNEVAYKAKFQGQRWNGPCAENITYHIDPKGSMTSYRYLLSLQMNETRKISIILYNGNWDAVVPYVDTLKNIRKLNLVEVYIYNPWYTEGQHSGFEQVFSGVVFVIFKGASHQVPQTKRAEAYNLFNSILAGHGDGSIHTRGVFPKYV